MNCSTRHIKGKLIAILLWTVLFLISSNQLLKASNDVKYINNQDSVVTSKEYLLKKIPHLLTRLRNNERANLKLSKLLNRVRISVPNSTLVEGSPNAYALTGLDSQKWIVVEVEYLYEIFDSAPFGGLFSTSWSDTRAYYFHACQEFQDSYREAIINNMEKPTYRLSIDDYFNSSTSLGRKIINKLTSFVLHDTVTWTILHEVAHHYLGHTDSISKEGSRRQESAADKWAFSMMRKLGYSLYWTSQYINAKSHMDLCLSKVGIINYEHESTHPSWTSRYYQLIDHFNITDIDADRIHIFYMPALAPEPVEMFIIVPPRKSNGYSATIRQGNNIIKGIVEWRQDSVYVYTRSSTGGRMEFVIPDGHNVVNKILWREFDRNNRFKQETTWDSFQQSVEQFGWLQTGNIFLSDLIGNIENNERTIRHLNHAGVAENQIPTILKVINYYEEEQKKILVPYMKGEIGFVSLKPKITPVLEKFEKALISEMGPLKYKKYEESVMNHPTTKFGLPNANVDSLENKLLDSNF